MKFTQKPIYQITGALALLLGTALPTFADSLIYIPMGSDNNILIVEQDSGKITGTIDNLASVHGLAGTPDGKFLVAASYEEREMGAETPSKPKNISDVDHAIHHPSGGSSAPKVKMGDMLSTVSIIDTATNKVVRVIDVPGSVHHVSVSDDGNYAVVTHTSAGSVSIIDLTSYELVANFATGDMPNYAAFSPDGKKLYVSNAGNDTVSIIDTKNWIVERNIIVGEEPEHMVLSNDGNTLFVNNVGGASTSFISLPDAKITKTINVGEIPHGLDLSDDGKTLFVAVKGDDLLVQIDVETAQKTKTISLQSPYHLTNIKNSDKLYLSSSSEPTIFIIDKKTFEKISEIDVGGKAHQMVQIK